MSKWPGQCCENDPTRTPADAREQQYSLADIAERAERGGAPGSCPGCCFLRLGVWKPKGRTDKPPVAAYKDDQTGQFGLAIRETWQRAWEDKGETWQGMFKFAEESGESKNR
eukprot:8630371-Alexandrium_andersonii.AAC.1